MVIQNVQLKSINGSTFQLLSIEPPLLQGNAGINLVDLDDVNISTTTNNWVVAWNSTQNKFVLAPPSNVSTNFITVNSNLSNTLNFGVGFNAQTITGVTSVNLDTNLDLLNDVVISNPSLGDRLVFNGSQWVNSPASSGSNTVTVNSSPNISTIVFSNQFGVNVVGNVANLSFTQTYDLESLTDVDLSAPLQGQLLRYTGTQWENSTLAFNPADFTVLNTVNATGVDLVAKPIEWLTNVNTTAPSQGQLLRYTGTQWENSTLAFNPADFTVSNTIGNTTINLDLKTINWLSDVTIANPQPYNYLSYDGSIWVNRSFNIGQSQAAYGTYLIQDNNVPTTNLFLDANSFNYGSLPSEDGWYIDFRGLFFKTVNGNEEGRAQSLEFPLEFIFSGSSFNDSNLPTPYNQAQLEWRSEAKPLSRFIQVLNITNNGQVLAHDHYGVDCSAGLLDLFLIDTPDNGNSVSITDITPLTSTFNGIRLNVNSSSGNKIDTSQVFFWNLNRGETKTFTFNSTNSTWYITDKIIASGVGVTDGDKGDITVSNSGTTWTIDNDAVNFSKIQNIGTGVLLGRSTSGSGDIESISLGSGLSLSGGTLSGTGSETGQSIVTKLESLTGTDRLNASAIEGSTGNITVFNEGIQIASNVNAIDFVGDGVNATFNNGLWTPNEIISSVNFWLEANSGYKDRSNTGRTPLNTGNRGTIATNVLNGNSVIQFTNTQGLAYSTAYDPSLVSIFAVVRYSNSDARILNIAGSNTSVGVRSLFDVTPARYVLNTGTTTQTNYTDGAIASNAWHVFEFRGSSLTLFNNGNSLSTSTSTTTVVTPESLANSRIHLNAVFYNTGTNTFSVFSGATLSEVAEIVVIDKTLSTTVHEQMEGYLAHKYGLTTNLPVSHPYKTNAPTSSNVARAIVNVTPSSGSSQTNLVEEITVSSPVSSISFSPDNLFFGEDYQLVLSGRLTAADSINLRINGDANSNGYDTQFFSVNNTTVTGARTINSSTIAFPTATTSDSFSITTFGSVNGWFRWVTQEVRDNSPAIVMAQNFGRRNSQISNLTSLVLVTGTGGVNFQTGFTARLYRLNNSTNLVNRSVQTSNFTALRNSNYPINSSAAPITTTLDISTNWRIGDRVTFFDDVGTFSNSPNTGFSLNPLTIQANIGQNISGSASIQLTNDCQSITLIYRGSGRFAIA